MEAFNFPTLFLHLCTEALPFSCELEPQSFSSCSFDNIGLTSTKFIDTADCMSLNFVKTLKRKSTCNFLRKN